MRSIQSLNKNSDVKENNSNRNTCESKDTTDTYLKRKRDFYPRGF